jgi:hypothetical protein
MQENAKVEFAPLRLIFCKNLHKNKFVLKFDAEAQRSTYACEVDKENPQPGESQAVGNRETT